MNRPVAIFAGALLFALPFFQSGLGESHSHGSAPHMDHAPRHGGALLMVGDYHLEIVEKEGSVELLVSDALRRPLRATGGVAIFDGGAARPLAWSSYRLTSDRPALYSSVEYRVTLADGTPVAITLAREDLARLSGATQSAFAR